MSRKQDKEWVEKRIEGIKRAWAEGKYAMAYTEERRRRISERHLGSKHTEETKAKISALKKGKPLPEHHRKALFKRRYSEEFKAKAAAHIAKYRVKGALSFDAEQRKSKNLSLAKTGVPNVGKVAKDNPEHTHAKYWIIRDPIGVTFEFPNLQSWCRANEHKFIDYTPESTYPLWHRASSGIASLQRRDKKAAHHWHGWTLISCLELTEGSRDLLGRDECEIKTHP